jgi:hypothetical protein
MELNQIFVFYKVEAFYPFITATFSDIIIFILFCVGNEPNGVISNISFYKLEAFHLKTFFSNTIL